MKIDSIHISPPIGTDSAASSSIQKDSSTPVLAQTQSELAAGHLLKGKVLSVAGDGNVLLSVGGKNITAQSHIPLQPGQEIWLEVLKNGDIPLLGQATRKGVVIDLMRQLASLERNGVSPAQVGGFAANATPTLLSGDAGMASSVEQFASAFAKSLFGAKADPGTLVNSLSLLGQFSGLQKEGKRNLEPKLMPAFSDLTKSFSGEGVLKMLREAEGGSDIGKLLNLFETSARLNTTPSESGQVEFLLFPCFFQGECGWGEWLFSFDRETDKEGRDGGKYSLTFFLEMSHLGEVQLQLQKDGDALTGVFTVEDEDAKAFLDANLSELHGILKELGFTRLTLSSQVGNVSNIQKLKEALSQGTRNTPFGLLDVTI